MGIRFENGYCYGADAGDTKEFLQQRARQLGGLVQFVDAGCSCQQPAFTLIVVQHLASVGIDCDTCRRRFCVGKQPVTLDDDSAELCVCECEGDSFDVCVGIVRQPGRSPRHFILAARCTMCGRLDCYAEWPLTRGRHRLTWQPVDDTPT